MNMVFALYVVKPIKVSGEYMYIEDLHISKALYYALKRAKIDDVETLLTYRRIEIMKLKGIGNIKIQEIEEKLNNYGGGYPLKD